MSTKSSKRDKFMPSLRLIARCEGISYLAILFVSMPLKYLADIHEPNYVFGAAHGALFIAYILWVGIAHVKYRWPIRKTALAFLLSILPFGTFWGEKKLFIDDRLNEATA